MLELKKDYEGKSLAYKLATGENEWCLSAMPSSVAAEIVRRADSVEQGGEDGFGLVVKSGAQVMLMPAEAFADGAAAKAVGTRRPSGR
jgi:hypothetical protein